MKHSKYNVNKGTIKWITCTVTSWLVSLTVNLSTKSEMPIFIHSKDIDGTTAKKLSLLAENLEAFGISRGQIYWIIKQD